MNDHFAEYNNQELPASLKSLIAEGHDPILSDRTACRDARLLTFEEIERKLNLPTVKIIDGDLDGESARPTDKNQRFKDLTSAIRARDNVRVQGLLSEYKDSPYEFIAVADRLAKQGYKTNYAVETTAVKADDGDYKVRIKVGCLTVDYDGTKRNFYTNPDVAKRDNDTREHDSSSERERDRERDHDFRPGSSEIKRAHHDLLKYFERILPEDRLRRLERYMETFEKRAESRIEAQVAAGHSPDEIRKQWSDKVVGAYKHLTHLVESNDERAVFSQTRRTQLAEIMMGQMAQPMDFHDQGQHGICWMLSGISLAVTQNPDKMARMLDQIATTGAFTDMDGDTHRIPASLLKFDRESANWSLSRNVGHNMLNPVSHVLAYSAAYLSDGRLDGGNRGGYHQNANEALRMITGHTWPMVYASQLCDYRQTLLDKGGVFILSKRQDHLYAGKLEKIGRQWQIVLDNQHGSDNDYTLAIVDDLKRWTVRKVSDWRTSIWSTEN